MAYEYLKSGSPVTFYSPYEFYHDQFQAFVDDQFDTSPTFYEVFQETYFASGSYEPVSVRVNRAIDSATGMKLGDDFKVIIFQTSSSSVDIGSKFYFDDNYWLTTATDNYKGLASSITVRRCNNTLRWRTESGSYLSEPCVIEYGITTPSNDDRADPTTPKGTIKVYAQLNSATNYIYENQRFIFGNSGFWQCYKIFGGGINNFFNNKTTNNSSAQMLQLSMGKSFLNENTDNLDYGIADYYIYESGSSIVNNVQILPVSGSILESGSQIFSVYRIFNGSATADVFTFTTSASSTVPTANYTLSTIDGNHFSVTNVARYLNAPLLIQCQSGIYLRVKDIYLRGAW